MSNFEKVYEWNKTFEIPVTRFPQWNILVTDQQFSSQKYNLIDEESMELYNAVSLSNFPEIYDALCDILVTAYGMGSGFGIDLDKTIKKLIKTTDSSTNYQSIKNKMLNSALKIDDKHYAFEIPSKPFLNKQLVTQLITNHKNVLDDLKRSISEKHFIFY